MSSEYDTLYSFLEGLLKNNPIQPEAIQNETIQNEIIQPLTISAIIPEEIILPNHVPGRKPGRPPGSKNKTKLRCMACFKTFHNDRLDKHIKKSKVCTLFYQLPTRPPALQQPIHQLIIDALDKATAIGDRCRFCEITITDMKQHMTDSMVCNRLAYAEFKNTI